MMEGSIKAWSEAAHMAASLTPLQSSSRGCASGLPGLALCQRGGGVERCPLLEARQKTSALGEYFAF